MSKVTFLSTYDGADDKLFEV